MHKNYQLSLLFPRQKDKECQSTKYSMDFIAHKFSTQIIYKVKNTLLPIADHEKKRRRESYAFAMIVDLQPISTE